MPFALHNRKSHIGSDDNKEKNTMNWILEAYAGVYQTVTGLGRFYNDDVALAKKRLEREDAKALRR